MSVTLYYQRTQCFFIACTIFGIHAFVNTANAKKKRFLWGVVEMGKKTARIVFADADVLLVAGGADRLFDTR